MSTLREAIEKVGVGGKVKHIDTHIVLFMGDTHVFLKDTTNNSEWSAPLNSKIWSPVLPKKRVVLQAWATADGCIIWVKEGFTVSAGLLCVRANDIPDMIFEDGKLVLDADA